MIATQSAIDPSAWMFESWDGILRVLAVGVLAYLSLLLVLRISGKRTLAKMNAFDLVVTVALGSTLASIITSKDVALLEGVLALAVLVSLQFVIAWLTVRSNRVENLVKAEPRLLLRRGQYLHAAMKAERVSMEEVDAAVRAGGYASRESVDAVVLETDGSFSIISADQAEPHNAMTSVDQSMDA